MRDPASFGVSPEEVEEQLRTLARNGSGESFSPKVPVGSEQSVSSLDPTEAARRQVYYMQAEQCRACLVAIREGRYGICQDCDEPIDKQRLEALPQATRCIGCQRLWEEGRGR